jgi:hypothetical protein
LCCQLFNPGHTVEFLKIMAKKTAIHPRLKGCGFLAENG